MRQAERRGVGRRRDKGKGRDQTRGDERIEVKIIEYERKEKERSSEEMRGFWR